MEIVKKNLISIICGVIALLAIAAIPTFISSQQKALQEQLKQRAATYTALDGLKNKQRHLPVVSASTDPNATAPELTGYPSPKVIELGKGAIAKVQAQSLQLEKIANEINVHKLLVDGSLPVVSDSFKFQTAYQAAMKDGIATTLNSSVPPTDQEINSQKLAKEKQLKDAAPKNQATGEPLFPDALAGEIQRELADLPERMRNEAARQHKIYMAPQTALSLHEDLNGTHAVPDEAVWLAQLSLWVHQDVAKAIADANGKSTMVATSPVKELVKIDVPVGRDMYTLPGAAAGASAAPSPLGTAAPSPVATNSVTDPLPKDFSVSPTGHVCNGVFDVVHFTVSMNVQAADVTRVIQAMEKGRLLTVYHTDIQSVNGAAKQQEGYFYGPTPVVTLTLKCEELFMRSWTRPLMPPPIKQFLNVQEPPAATASTN